jgi:hypothetical protein
VPANFKKDVRKQIYDLTYLIVDKGFSNYDPMKPMSSYLDGRYSGYRQNFRLCYTFSGKEFVGGAHGLLGNL